MEGENSGVAKSTIQCNTWDFLLLLLLVQITDLSKEVFRLKEALGALSPPLGITSSSSSPSLSPAHHNNPGQQVALQNRVAILTQQLQVRDEDSVCK